ncbi:hypothetical protein ACOMHN_050770 [Nucella lapillus]
MSTAWLLDRNTFGETAEQNVDNGTSFAEVFFQYPPTYMLWLTVPPVLLVLGCFGNVMTIVVMSRMRASESTACLSVYFTALAVSDLCLLCSSVVWLWPENAFNAPVSYFNDASCSLSFYTSYVSSITSAWLLMAMTGHRLVSVVVPHRVGVLCTVKRGRIITATIVITACVFNIYFFFTYHVEITGSGFDTCVSSDEEAGIVFRFLDLCLASVVPFLFLIIANSVLISRVMRSVQVSQQMKTGHQITSQRVKVSSMTTTLILTSLAFLVLTLPTCLMDMYLEMVGFYTGAVGDGGLNQRLALAETVCILLWIGNSAVNFYIYVLSGRKFRRETKRCLCWSLKPRQSSTTWTT